MKRKIKNNTLLHASISDTKVRIISKQSIDSAWHPDIYSYKMIMTIKHNEEPLEVFCEAFHPMITKGDYIYATEV